MKRYFKSHASDLRLGDVTIWVEFEGDYPLRQAERVGDHWYNSLDEPTRIVDQPLSGLDPEIDDDEISREEFEAAWAEAIAQRL